MNDQVRVALWSVAVGFIVVFTCVFVFVFDPTRSFLGVIGIGVPLGLVIAAVFALFVALVGDQYLPP
jgi:NhaP-type Na+/H+ or K+/H+ antiporter